MWLGCVVRVVCGWVCIVCRMAKQKKQKFTAKTADRHMLYQLSVQEPEHEIEFFDRAYRECSGNRRSPKVLREDFCGTFAVCCEWVKKRGRTAMGVDLDPEPLEWGRSHNLSALTPSQQKQVTLVEDDVRTVSRTKADVLAAQNFSFWIFRTREELRQYFEIARRNLAKDGILVMDMMGGGECFVEGHRDVRKIDGDETRQSFKYIWEQVRYNPVNHESMFRIHFRFKDGTRLENAFEYNWRFWSIPEVRELLSEAGFSRSYVYWEGAEPNGEGDGNWGQVEEAPSDPSWIAYVVAVK